MKYNLKSMEQKEWFLYVVDHHEGPFTEDEIKKLVKNGEAKDTSFVWKEGMADWVMMNNITEFGPGSAQSDGHGPFSFITNMLPGKKPEPKITAQNGPDISDVNASDSIWCLNSKRQFSGPHSLKTIIRKINDGEVQVTDTVWKEGWSSFVSITSIPGFMSQVQPDAITGKVEKKKSLFSFGTGGSAAALGLGGKSSVRSQRWYNSTAFKTLLVMTLLVGLYHNLVTGQLDSVLDRAPGTKEKVKALQLPPIPFDKAIEAAGTTKEFILSTVQKNISLLPEPVRGWVSTLQLPEGLSAHDVENLREVAFADLKQGARVATALPIGDEINPAFIIVTNLPDGTSFQVTLRGKEGTLLNATGFEKSATVEVTKHIGMTPRFYFDTNKPLPKGEYSLTVFESDKQPSVSAAEALATTVPPKAAPASIPRGKVAFAIDAQFLGGKKDATYVQRIKEFNDRILARRASEALELKQLALLMEQITNESATKFQTLMGKAATPRRKSEWGSYHANYQKLSEQIKGVLSKLTPEGRKQLALPQHYAMLESTYQLTERLHQTETEILEKNGKIEALNDLAQQTSDALLSLKAEIDKLIK